MTVLRYFALSIALAFATLAQGQSPAAGQHLSAGERLIGAWRLVRIESPGPDGKPTDTPQPIGMLIYTADGHVSVQLMYPEAASGLSNEYVRNGYEASFGTFEVNEAAHTVTHHIQGSNTGGLLVGKDLPRAFQFTADGHLVIRPANPEEHWLVTWQHY